MQVSLMYISHFYCSTKKHFFHKENVSYDDKQMALIGSNTQDYYCVIRRRNIEFYQINKGNCAGWPGIDLIFFQWIYFENSFHRNSLLYYYPIRLAGFVLSWDTPYGTPNARHLSTSILLILEGPLCVCVWVCFSVRLLLRAHLAKLLCYWVNIRFVTGVNMIGTL